MNRIFVSVLLVIAGSLATSAQASPASVCHPLEMREPLPGNKGVAQETIQRLLDDGERAYRLREFPQAKAAYIAALELAPDNEAAWLRLGNIQQLLGCKELALFAYRHLLPKSPDAIQETQARGVLNLALIAGEQLTEALNMLAKVQLPDDLVLLHTELKSRYARQAPPPLQQAVQTTPSYRPVAVQNSLQSLAPPAAPSSATRSRAPARNERPELPLVQYVGGVQGPRQ
jgi:tetratricopeptide (TPR) repeat protein